MIPSDSGRDPGLLGIRGVGDLYRREELSPVALVRSLLERIDRYEARLNAWICVRRDEALAEAHEAERRFRTGQARGPLEGIPVCVKDNMDMEGLPTTCASRAGADAPATRDATAVRRLRQAGAIVLGKNNLLEFAYAVVHPDYGQCNNPWDASRTAGGSTSGGAAAVAAGMACAALGSDTGGSIRIPAAYCGIVGLKPTFGRVSRAGVFPLAWSLDHVGPLTRSVEDAAIVLSAIAGPDAADRSAYDAPLSLPEAWDAARLDGLRVGLIPDHVGEGLSAGVRAAFDRAVQLFRDDGAATVEVTIPTMPYAEEALQAIIMAEAASVHEERYRAVPDAYSSKIRLQLEAGMLTSALDYLRAQRVRERLIQDFAAAFDHHVDVIIAPTAPWVAPRDDPHPGVVGRRRTRAMRRTGPYNLAGLPAISVPCGIAEEGLPVGLQIAGPHFGDARILEVAHAFEARSGWKPVMPRDVQDAVVQAHGGGEMR
jgi:aspartyl-tRNA(Asn)/glutamyl-tRNA(Gln) amidotransferase subunit A